MAIECENLYPVVKLRCEVFIKVKKVKFLKAFCSFSKLALAINEQSLNELFIMGYNIYESKSTLYIDKELMMPVTDLKKLTFE